MSLGQIKEGRCFNDAFRIQFYNFVKLTHLWDRKWTGNGPEVAWKLPGRGPGEWTVSGPEVDRKWTGSGPEVDRK